MLIVVVGLRGSGKSLYLAMMALKSNRPVYSNFTIKCKDFHFLDVVDILNLPTEIEVMLDEAYTWIEARTSTKALNRYMSYIAFQLRKRNMNIFLSVQQFSTIDVRYRNEWDTIVKCERVNNGNSDKKKWDFKYSFLDKRSLKSGSWRLPYESATKYFDYFDTYEIVEPYDKEKLELEILKDAPDLFWSKVVKVGDELLPTLDKITKDSVKVGLLKLGYDKSYANYVYLYLKKYFN